LKDLQYASAQVSEYEDRLQETSQRSLVLLKQLKDCENEIDTLKTYIIDLKSRIAVYIPVKSDSIDKKLAEYINNYPERSKLKIMFMRESEGIYQFGTKKVYVRVD
jgi:septal ring factor EnvC (AmiA/AmiB activator)